MDNIKEKTKNEITNIVLCIYNQYRTEDILNELNLLKSRLSIVNFQEISKLSELEQTRYIITLVEDEVNTTTQIFIKRIINGDLLKEMLSSNFDYFIDEFEKQSKNKADILFFSAIDLSSDLQKKVSEDLRKKYPNIFRTVFLKDAELIAGFKVIILEKEFDYSLKNNGQKLIYHTIRGKI